MQERQNGKNVEISDFKVDEPHVAVAMETDSEINPENSKIRDEISTENWRINAPKTPGLKNHTPSMWVFYSAEEDEIVILIPICFWNFRPPGESEEFLDSPDAYLCEMAREDGSTVYVHVNKETVAKSFEIVGVL